MQPWECIHIDELYPHHQMPPIHSLLKGCVSSVLAPPDMGKATSEENPSQRVTDVISSAGFERLFESCILPAMSILKDESEEGIQREDRPDNKHANIRRVKKLNNLLQVLKEPDRSGFLDMLRKRIYLLQKDREGEENPEQNAKKWLSKVATTSRETKMLTFRSQVRQYIQNKMTGLIAGIIAFADSNNNLDILLKEGEVWKKQMWLKMMNNEEAIHLSIKEDLGQSEPQEIPVKSHGADRSTRESHLPFSWKIYKQIDDLMKSERTGDTLDAALKVPSTLKKNDMWKILIEALNGAESEEVVKKRVLDNYLPDFVAMVYTSNTGDKEHEYEVVQNEISRQYNILLNTSKEQKEKRDITPNDYIPLIHAAFTQIESRIEFYSQMVQLCPEIVGKMRQEHSEKSDLNLDLQAVKTAIVIMRPSEKKLRNPKDSKTWYEMTGRITPLINQALDMDTDETVINKIDDLKNEWERIITVRMFATVVYPPKSDKSNMQVYCPLLLFTLQEKQNMKSRETMKAVDKFFISITNMEKTRLTKSGDYKKCTTCGKDLVDVHLLPCGHEACFTCTEQQRQAHNVKCPQCKKTPPGNTGYKKQFSSGLKKLRSFATLCQSFRMELVKRVCQYADDGLIHLLIDNISDPLVENVDEGADQRMRGMLLQLLMPLHRNKVTDHLNKLFAEAEKMGKTKLDLAILFIQCIEDINHRSKINNDQDMVKDTAGMLLGNIEALKTPGFNTDKLEAIALTRFCLSGTASWLERIYIQKDETGLKSFTNELLPVVKTVCSELQWPRNFLIKVLMRRFRPTLKETQPGSEGIEKELDLSTDDRAALTDRLQQVQAILQEVLHTPIAVGDNLGINKLLQMVYETEEDSTDDADPVNMAVMWRYRPQATFGTATQRLTELRQGRAGQNELLYYFMQNEHALREVQRLPRVIKFQNLLLQTYNYKISQREASEITIRQFLNRREKDGDEECEELFKDYQQVWNIREHGKTQEGLKEGPSKPLELDTTLDKFLPKSDPLIELVQIHNSLIEQLGNSCNLGPDVNLLDVKSTHLVTYDPDKDLLPLVTANCSSRLQVGQGTNVKYDFDKMEYQLTEHLFEGKSRIVNMETTMTFSDNLTTVHKLENVEKNIQQESFTPAVETEIRKDTHLATEVYSLVTNLNIAISFLHTTGGDPERKLDDFMEKDLKMDPAPLPRTTKEHCQFKHIRALWLMMCNEREKHAAQLGGIPFSTLTEERYDIYREPLNTAQIDHLRKGLVHTKKLEKLLIELFTCIALKIIKQEVSSTEPLTDYLDEGQVDATALQMPDGVDAISVSQCMYTWRAVYHYSRDVAY